MYFFRRAVIFVVGSATVLVAHGWYDRVGSPRQAADVAVASLNGGDAEAWRARVAGEMRSAADDAAICSIVILAAVCFVSPLMRDSFRSQMKGDRRA
jgi:hypothetical protein